MVAVLRIRIDYRQIHKAERAKMATAAQTALILAKDKLQEKLMDVIMDDFSDRVLESEKELLHINESDDGRIWLSVIEHRPIDIGLDELGISDEEQAAIKEELRRVVSALKAK